MTDTPAEILRRAIHKVTGRHTLSREEMSQVVEFLMTCDLSKDPFPILAGALICSLKTRGETVDELIGAAKTLQKHQHNVAVAGGGEAVIDTCGTGGDGAHLINISTITGIVVASLGVTVAKHGNRSVSSACGSADLLEELGYPLVDDPGIVAQLVSNSGFGFLFAPHFHPALKNLAGFRRSLGVRTIFNMLGPLVNPCAVTHQLIGVFDRGIVSTVAQAAAQLGPRRVLVVHGEGGLDELSPFGTSWVSLCEGDRHTEMEWRPEDFGAAPVTLDQLAGGPPSENADKCRRLLAGQLPEMASAVAMNCAACLWLVEKAASLQDGYDMAMEALNSGRAGQHFHKLKTEAVGLTLKEAHQAE